jgi:hypothetical protein
MVAKQQLMLAGLNPQTLTVSEVEMATVWHCFTPYYIWELFIF